VLTFLGTWGVLASRSVRALAAMEFAGPPNSPGGVFDKAGGAYQHDALIAMLIVAVLAAGLAVLGWLGYRVFCSKAGRRAGAGAAAAALTGLLLAAAELGLILASSSGPHPPLGAVQPLAFR